MKLLTLLIACFFLGTTSCIHARRPIPDNRVPILKPAACDTEEHYWHHNAGEPPEGRTRCT